MNNNFKSNLVKFEEQQIQEIINSHDIYKAIPALLENVDNNVKEVTKTLIVFFVIGGYEDIDRDLNGAMSLELKKKILLLIEACKEDNVLKKLCELTSILSKANENEDPLVWKRFIRVIKNIGLVNKQFAIVKKMFPLLHQRINRSVTNENIYKSINGKGFSFLEIYEKFTEGITHENEEKFLKISNGWEIRKQNLIKKINDSIETLEALQENMVNENFIDTHFFTCLKYCDPNYNPSSAFFNELEELKNDMNLL